MHHRSTPVDLPNLLAALRSERSTLLSFIGHLTDAEWEAPSAAAGWRVADVVAHISATALAFYTPAGLSAMRAASLEAHNEDPVARRRDWSRERVVAEYEATSRRSARLLALISRTPAARIRLPLADLGRFPLALTLGGALVFDHYVHLRHDVAPAVGRQAPSTDPDTMRAVLTWMMAVLGNQVARQPVPGLAGAVTLELTGPGGGSWRVDDRGVADHHGAPSRARVVAPTLGFPNWATQRSSWRDHTVEIAGDTQLAERFLDSVNII